MRIAAITSAGACGIADYSDQLRAALQLVDPSVEVISDPAWLDPEVYLHAVLHHTTVPPDVTWLNHHAALHARWTPAHIEHLHYRRIPVVATLHDTRAGTLDAPNTDQLRGLYEVCDATIVHEPVADLSNAHYIRHGVPLAQTGWQYGPRSFSDTNDHCFLDYVGQPILGSVGFAFPWKCFPEMCREARAAGWAQVILSNNATPEQEAEWRSLNPALLVVREFLPQATAISYLSGCDATAVLYRCANNGTSGALRQCLGARKPVLAFRCRQFRDVEIAEREEWGIQAIRWTEDFDTFRRDLTRCPIQRIDPGIAFIAAQDAWPKQAARYLEIFRGVVRG